MLNPAPAVGARTPIGILRSAAAVRFFFLLLVNLVSRFLATGVGGGGGVGAEGLGISGTEGDPKHMIIYSVELC